MKLMVRVTNWVGDAVMSLPALQALREACPNDEVVLVARPWVADLYKCLGVGDRVIVHDPRKSRAALAAELRAEEFDAALLLPNSFDAAWIAWRAGIPKRWGYARDFRTPLLTRAIPRPRGNEIPEHQAYYYLELLRRLDMLSVRSTSLPSIDRFCLPAPAPRTKHATNGPLVGLNPGAAFGTAKRWIPSRYAELGRRLRNERGASIVIFGAAQERELAEAIAGEIGAGATSTAGKTTLGEFLELARTCDLFVTNDTGTMHLAAAAGVSVLAIFGATDERSTSPLGPRVRLLKHPVSCSPCLLRHCPVDHRCMRSISVDEVFKASCETLDSAPPFSSTVTGR
jgi:heptosyltransferase-2